MVSCDLSDGMVSLTKRNKAAFLEQGKTEYSRWGEPIYCKASFPFCSYPQRSLQLRGFNVILIPQSITVPGNHREFAGADVLECNSELPATTIASHCACTLVQLTVRNDDCNV